MARIKLALLKFLRSLHKNALSTKNFCRSTIDTKYKADKGGDSKEKGISVFCFF